MSRNIIALASVLAMSLITAAYSQTYQVPEILYYKFNNGTTTTPNYAVPGQGLNPALLLNMSMGPGGQFDSALVGNGGTGTTTYVNSGWNMNVGTSSWTISLWINGFPSVTGTSYIFGNDITTSFRCFTNGAAGSGNITLRANNFANVNVTGVLPGPSVIHFVYDSGTPSVRTYVNGFFQSSVAQAALNLSATVPFKVGSYGTATSIPVGAMVDEFRFYNRALDSAEIAATWNHALPHTVTGVSLQIDEIPSGYGLEQNYPNPFNPITTIKYDLPKESQVTLKLFNILGQEVATLVNEEQKAGYKSVDWDGSNVSSGVYFYRMQAGDFMQTRKLVLLK
jgi:hypothetical protein